MRVEVLAVGTELLLGQVVDTNSAWIGQQLAAVGVDCLYQAKVGDNASRIELAIRSALERCDALVICGGLGPTVDDITRDVIADVMGVAMVRDSELLSVIEGLFAARGRVMTDNNLRQADVPAGATVIAQRLGTAPGLRCPVVVGGESRVIYALPGVPHEMQEMFTRGVLPELITQNGPDKAIVSRVLRACGVSESAVDEQLRPIVDELDRLVEGTSEPVPTIAYLASGIEGLKIRLSVKSVDGEAANRSLSMLEAQVRDVLGDSVFGVGDQTLEAVVGDMLVARGLTLGLAESLTAGLAGARCGDVVGASRWFRGSIVGYATDVKRSVLGVTAPLVVSSACAIEMAEGARRALSSHVGLSFTGVAGPDSQDGQAPGTVFIGLAIHGRPTESLQLSLPGDRASVRAYSVVSGFDWLRRRL